MRARAGDNKCLPGDVQRRRRRSRTASVGARRVRTRRVRPDAVVLCVALVGVFELFEVAVRVHRCAGAVRQRALARNRLGHVPCIGSSRRGWRRWHEGVATRRLQLGRRAIGLLGLQFGASVRGTDLRD